MAKYTKTQADNCIIQRCNKVSEGGSYMHHTLCVRDDNGFFQKWNDVTLSSSPTQSEIQTAMINYLTGIEKPAKQPVVTTVKDTEVLGKKVKDI